MDGLGLLLHFRVEDGTHRLFAGERRGTKVGATFGGALPPKKRGESIIQQIATELKEESFGQFRFAEENGAFRKDEKTGKYIILHRPTKYAEEKELLLEFSNCPNHLVDNRKRTDVGFNMRFFTLQTEISGLTEEELYKLAEDKRPTAKLWHTIYGKLAELKWNAPEAARNEAKEEVKALYIQLQKEHGEFLVEPATVFGTQNIDQALGIIFGEMQTEQQYSEILREKVGSYSESSGSTIVRSDALKALAMAGQGPLADIKGHVITNADGAIVKDGFIGSAMRGLTFPAPQVPQAVNINEKEAGLQGNYRYGKFSPPPQPSSRKLDVACNTNIYTR